jgi:hypothetical protein
MTSVRNKESVKRASSFHNWFRLAIDIFLETESKKRSLNKNPLSNILDSIKNEKNNDFLEIIKESTGTNVKNLVSQDIKFNLNFNTDIKRY